MHVPGRYRVEIQLNQPVESTAEVVRFVKKKAVLKCVLRVKDEHVQWKRRHADPCHHSPGQASGSSDEDMPPLVNDRGVPVTGPHVAAAAASPGRANGHEAATPTQPPQRPAPASQRQPARPPQQQAQQPAGGRAQQAQQPQGDIYAQAKQQANRDAAEDCERLARKAEQQGDLQRAVRGP